MGEDTAALMDVTLRQTIVFDSCVHVPAATVHLMLIVSGRCPRGRCAPPSSPPFQKIERESCGGALKVRMWEDGSI